MSFASFFDRKTRTGRFFRTLFTSFIHLGAATLYSFFLIPLILHFSDAETLGLWLLIAQIGIYLTMVDAGLSALSIRQFVGPISAGDFTGLTPRFQATLLLSVGQGLLICLIGFFGPWFSALFGISDEFKHLFSQLFLAQCVLVGVSFPFRPFSSILLAAQRFDSNYLVSSAAFLCAILLTALGFQQGWGLWSVVAGGALQTVASSVASVWGVQKISRLSLLFMPGHLRTSLILQVFRESTFFASGSVFSTLGGLWQSTVLSRFFGLEGVAAWNVGAKIATVLSQILSKFFESSFAGLSELEERQQRALVADRFFRIFFPCLTLSATLSLCILFLNQPFIDWWTKGEIRWPNSANAAVGAWLVATTLHRGLAVLVGILLLWRAIRLAPALDFVVLALASASASLTGDFTIFCWSLAAAPLLGGILVYGTNLAPMRGFFPPLSAFRSYLFLLALAGFFFLLIVLSSR